MDFYLIFNITTYIASIIALVFFVYFIIKKRFSKKFLYRFFAFLLFIGTSKTLGLFFFKNLNLTEDSGNYLIMSFLIVVVTFAYFKNCKDLNKIECENIW